MRKKAWSQETKQMYEQDLDIKTYIIFICQLYLERKRYANGKLTH